MRWLSLPTAIATLLLLTPVAEAAVVEYEELLPAPGDWAVIVSSINDSGQVTGGSYSPGALPTTVRWEPAAGRGDANPTVLGKQEGYGMAVNNRGNVLMAVAWKSAGALITRVSAWENGKVVDRSPNGPTAGSQTMRDINDSGLIPMSYSVSDNGFRYPNRAGVWRNGVFVEIPMPKGLIVSHRIVNNRGTTAGDARPADSDDYVFRCTGTRCTTLPRHTTGGAYSPQALNESDVLAGTWWSGKGTTRAVLWTGDRVTALPGDDAGVADNPHAINESNDVAGWRVVDGAHKATLWRGGALIDLGTTGPSEAVAVNDRGDVAGWQTIDQKREPFFWRAGTLTRLTPPSGVFAKAVGLSNTGAVIANSEESGAWHAFRWTIR
ncbi:hypothetical protein [Saccharothrix obliqua]|uniref:hypothetical protein n=1 Tax=Saccharothrix obliqua TaxID=2861747 RepID=UPI001C5F99CC|nr:hypothetical protein [Saccharothrix obliqua]MBW4718632.1 hypothetical protein [Saccharothrix obliqua]